MDSRGGAEMRIEDKRKQVTQTKFGDLMIGEVFEYGDYIFVRTMDLRDEYGDLLNSFCLNDGEMSYSKDDLKVTPISVKVVIE